MARESFFFNPSLNHYVQDLMNQLKQAGYSEGTCHFFLSYLKPVQTYMDSRAITEYSPPVGCDFLNHYYQTYRPEGRKKRESAYLIQMLNDCYNGTSCIVKKQSSVIYNKSLAKYVNGLLELLSSLGYTEGALDHYLSRLRPIQTYMAKNGISDYTPEVGREYYDHYIRTHEPCIDEQRGLKACIRRLNDFYAEKQYINRHSDNELQEIPLSFQNTVDRFFDDVEIYSASKSTVSRRKRALARFLNKCVHCNVTVPAEFTPEIVLISCRDVTDIDDWTTVRQFLSFLVKNNETEHDLSCCIPKGHRDRNAPSTYSVEELQSLESSVDRDTYQGKRDYAVLLMADRLAIRAGDIASLKLENIDFGKESISFIQIKTGTEVTLPLVPELKDALQDYLENSSFNDDYIFHSLRAPYRPITGNTVYALVDKYFRKADINTSGKKHGPHALRASVTTSMINDDVPYEAVRDALGHTSPNSIRHYAKNDIEKLRRCAIPVPEASGSFRQFLQGGEQS